jgi:gliding motility-associated-like protein
MKLRLLLLFLFTGIYTAFAQQPSIPNTYINDTGDTISLSSAVFHTVPYYPPPSPLACASSNNHATPYNQNNGQRGIMFDITALTNITINCFDVNLDAGTANVAIYYKVGTHVGFTTTPGAWTLIGTANNVTGANNVPTAVPVTVNVAVTAGCTVAFYITRTQAGGPLVNYTNGTAVGFVYSSNADLQVKDGTGKDYPFGASFTPRRFNGTIYYTLTSGPSGGTVTGPLSMCAGTSQTYTYTGLGWTSYNWTVPAGTTITTGQGTNTITITAGSTAGNICCTPSGACGPGPVACLAVSIAPQPSSTSSVVNVTCNGSNNGSATINPIPASTYTYTWSPNVGNTQTVTGLSPGTYTVTATNSGGCFTTQTITVTQPTALTASQSQVDLVCNGMNTGSATVNPSGGVPGYSYGWAPSGGNAATASSLAAGTYTCTITDNNGCANTQTFTITTPAALNLATSSTPSVCGSPNGSASVVVSGGTGAYTYSWSPSGGNAATETGLLGGSYVVTVTDANNCVSTATVNVVGASTPTAVVSASTNILCNGGNNGSATVTPGGNGPYTYAWSSGGNAATENGLTAGTYTITITDVNGCTATDTVTLTEPPLLTSNIVSTNVLCNGAATGSATMNAAGGNPAYVYSWAPTGGNAATANALTAQSYTCTVTDANGCLTSSVVTLTEPPALTTTASQVDVLCSGANTGSATVNPSGGAPGYSYAWMPSGGNAPTASSLTAQSYTCTITDMNGCTLAQTFTITEPVTVVAASGPVTHVDCFGQSTGAITVTQSGGVPPYSYAWMPNVTATPTANSIPAGAYQIVVTDANGCSSTITITITEPPLLTLQASAAPAVICNGQQAVISSVPAGGAAGYNVVWNPGNLSGVSQNVTPAATTTYTATVTDANGCTATMTTSVTVNPVPVAAFSANVVAGCTPVCVDFSDLSTIGAPGVIVAWDWDFGDGNTATTQNPSHCYTTPGVYTVILTAKSADGCTHTFTLANYISAYVNPVAAFTMNPQPTTVFNAQIYFTDESSNASSWVWSFGDVQNSTSVLQDPTFLYFAPECYQVLLTVTSPNGCTDSISHPVCIDPDVSIYVPNAFTPNDDNTNEIFIPIAIGIDPAKYQFWIFDRWGNILFSTNDMTKGWDGKVQGHADPCQVDTYVWKIIATDTKGVQYKRVGSVNLIR